MEVFTEINQAVLELAEKAGAKIFMNKTDGSVRTICIADDGSSGDGTQFVCRFASLLKEHYGNN